MIVNEGLLPTAPESRLAPSIIRSKPRARRWKDSWPQILDAWVKESNEEVPTSESERYKMKTCWCEKTC
jgi:hypothetical protein